MIICREIMDQNSLKLVDKESKYQLMREARKMKIEMETLNKTWQELKS